VSSFDYHLLKFIVLPLIEYLVMQEFPGRLTCIILILEHSGPIYLLGILQRSNGGHAPLYHQAWVMGLLLYQVHVVGIRVFQRRHGCEG